MDQKKLSGYEKLVLVAYGYFMLIALVFLLLRLYVAGDISYVALVVMAVFAMQFWHRHRLANLIIGVLTLGSSIFALLEFLAAGMKSSFNSFYITMTSVFVAAIVFSGILVFSYARLSFHDHQQ